MSDRLFLNIALSAFLDLAIPGRVLIVLEFFRNDYTLQSNVENVGNVIYPNETESTQNK